MEGGLLQAFYMMFKANADEAQAELERIEKAADDAGKSAEKATDKFEGIGKKAPDGIKKAEGAARGLKNELLDTQKVSSSLSTSFLNFAKGLAGPLLAGFSLGGIAQIARTRAAEIDEVSKAADRAGTKIGNFEALTRTARQAGGEIKKAEADLETVRKNVGEALINPKGQQTKTFAALGISLKTLKKDASDTTDVLLRVAGAVEKMDRNKAEAYIRKLGITDKGLQTAIMEGRKRLQEFIDTEKEFGVTTEDQVQIVSDYMATWDNFGDVLKVAGNSIMEAVLPAFTKVLDWTAHGINYLVKHKTLVIGFFVGVAGAITAIYLPAITSAVTATIALLAPYLAIAAAVAAVGVAFALAYEDVQYFLNGQPSLLGELVKKYEWVAETVKAIGEAWKFVRDTATVVGDELSSIWDNQSKMNDQSVKDIQASWEWLKTALGPLGNEIGRDLTGFWEWVKADWADATGQLEQNASHLKEVWGTVTTWFSDQWSKVEQSFADAGPAIENELNEIKATIDRIIKRVGDAIYNGFNAAIEKVKSLWQGFKDWLSGLFSGFSMPSPSMPSMPGWNPGGTPQGGWGNSWQYSLPNGPGAPKAPGPVDAAAIRGALNANIVAGESPLNSRTGEVASLGPTTNNNTKEVHTTVNVGGVVVNAPGGDAAGIAAGIDNQLKDSFRATTNSIDDGVKM